TETFRQLTRMLGTSAACVNQVALSDYPGEMTLHVARGRSKLNSVHYITGVHTAEEVVPMTTLDAYTQQANLDRIDLLTVDTAGHDLAVLEGASGLLRAQRISVILLNHNEFWIYARSFLRDAFRLLEPLGYRLGKLTHMGVDFYPTWHQQLETF